MEFEIKQVTERKIAGFHMVGQWEKTVPQGFKQLSFWVENQKLTPKEWLAVYYDNPEVVPAAKLRCDIAISVEPDFLPPANSEGVIVTTLPGGQYAIARVVVDDNDFASPWYLFFTSLETDSHYQKEESRPCFEHYLNEGRETGLWEIDMYIPVRKK